MEDWAGHLLQRPTGPERRRMLRSIAQTLRRSQQRPVRAAGPGGPSRTAGGIPATPITRADHCRT
ncbi:hypothetical protein [Pseudomonas sp. dw_358]|uniref:hypothetical protein n=1 Tax=Pseudomonas sp. dw_358 TaxID=2720083 RepID=UPI0031F6F0F6